MHPKCFTKKMIKDRWRQDFQSQCLFTSSLSSNFLQEDGWHCFQFQLNVPTAQLRKHHVAPAAGVLHHFTHEPERSCSLKTNGANDTFMIRSSGPVRNWTWNHTFSTSMATGRLQDSLSISVTTFSFLSWCLSNKIPQRENCISIAHLFLPGHGS